MLCNYNIYVKLYKTFNKTIPSREWTRLNFNQINMKIQQCFLTKRSNNLTIGMNALAYRFHNLNGKIPLEWLINIYVNVKLDCKNLFLKFDLICYMARLNLCKINYSVLV